MRGNETYVNAYGHVIDSRDGFPVCPVNPFLPVCGNKDENGVSRCWDCTYCDRPGTSGDPRRERARRIARDVVERAFSRIYVEAVAMQAETERNDGWTPDLELLQESLFDALPDAMQEALRTLDRFSAGIF